MFLYLENDFKLGDDLGWFIKPEYMTDKIAQKAVCLMPYFNQKINITET